MHHNLREIHHLLKVRIVRLSTATHEFTVLLDEGRWCNLLLLRAVTILQRYLVETGELGGCMGWTATLNDGALAWLGVVDAYFRDLLLRNQQLRIVWVFSISNLRRNLYHTPCKRIGPIVLSTSALVDGFSSERSIGSKRLDPFANDMLILFSLGRTHLSLG